MYVSIPDCFIISFIIGFIYGLIYEGLRIVRLLFPFKSIVFLCDVIFFIIASKIIMILSLELGCYLRIYTLVGFVSGVYSYIVTIGRILNYLENSAANSWRKAIHKTVDSFAQQFNTIFMSIYHKTKSAIGKFAEYHTKLQKNRILHLKSNGNLMYNKYISDKIGGNPNVIKASVKSTRKFK